MSSACQEASRDSLGKSNLFFVQEVMGAIHGHPRDRFMEKTAIRSFPTDATVTQPHFTEPGREEDLQGTQEDVCRRARRVPGERLEVLEGTRRQVRSRCLK